MSGYSRDLLSSSPLPKVIVPLERLTCLVRLGRPIELLRGGLRLVPDLLAHDAASHLILLSEGGARLAVEHLTRVLHHDRVGLTQLRLQLVHNLGLLLRLIIVELLLRGRWLLLSRMVEVLGRRLAAMVQLGAAVRGVASPSLILSVVSASKGDPRLHLLFAKYPIVLEVEVVSFPDKEVSEHGYQLLIVWFLLKLKLPAVVEELA